MELFRNTNFDFLGKKWPFIIASLVLTGGGLASTAAKGGIKYGIDFRGGVDMSVKFSQRPSVDNLRKALAAKIPGEITVTEELGGTQVIISTELKSEKELDTARKTMADTLAASFGTASGKLDFHNAGQQAVVDRLRDPIQRAGLPMNDALLREMVKGMMAVRDGNPNFGILKSLDQLGNVDGMTPQTLAIVKQELDLAPFAIRNVDLVGPKIGAELRNQAVLATLYALAGMLVFIAFRFEWIYGVAAVIAVFHDTIITLGLFSLFDKEVSLTVIAALLTLVGYSMNDTIVVFDRIRENLKLMRREKFEPLVNTSVNQTLSRTVLTSGLTLLTALALLLFGGQVLNGFSFALVVGIIVGTYSSVFIASPILIFWKNWMEKRGGGGTGKPVAVSK
ncbi:MAG: protein translocase subunit SecF [Candidatus Solibacter usitatus]|nr:protein translocase subunit SecF [Candidatus Solibacter usitatus]